MISEKLKQIIEKLKKATSSETIIWDHTSSDTEYYTSFKSGRITIDSWHIDEAGRDAVDLSIYNVNGLRIEYLVFYDTESLSDYNYLMQLYQIVNNKYLRAEETLDEIIEELDADDIPF